MITGRALSTQEQAGVALRGDEFAERALATLEARLASAGALPDAVLVQFENNARTSMAADGAYRVLNPRPFVLQISIPGAEVRQAWGAVLCECIRLMPELELVAAASPRYSPLLEEDCVEATEQLDALERFIHEQFEDSAATWAEYASFGGDWIVVLPTEEQI